MQKHKFQISENDIEFIFLTINGHPFIYFIPFDNCCHKIAPTIVQLNLDIVLFQTLLKIYYKLKR